MQFNIGHIVRNKLTQEHGRVVRITDTDGKVAYVVAIDLDLLWGVTGKEALWIESQVKRAA